MQAVHSPRCNEQILSNLNSTFSLYLWNIQIGNLHASIMFSHILLYLIICCLSLCRCYIHIIKLNCDINVIIRLLFQLGQKNYRLHMHITWEHIPTNSWKYGHYLCNTNTARVALFPQNHIRYALCSTLPQNFNHLKQYKFYATWYCFKKSIKHCGVSE